MVPKGWTSALVGELCRSIVPGRNKPKRFDGSIPWVTTPEIQGRYIPSSVQKNYVDQDSIDEANAKIVPSGSVVISCVGELGLVALNKEPVVLNQQLHAFVCPDYINNEYLAYWLETKRFYMESVASKTTIPYMNKANCESIPVSYPPLPEQCKIAQILSTWDKAITTTERLLTNRQQQKKALMQRLLTGKQRFAGFEGEWKLITIDKAFRVITDYVASGSFAALKANVTVYESEEYAHYVRQTDLAANFKNKNLKFVDRISYQYLNKSNLFPDDILFTNIGDLGKVFYMPKLDKPATVAPNLVVLRTNQNYDSKFIYYLLASSIGQREIDKIKSGTGLPKISKTDFKTMIIHLPLLGEQQKIASVLSAADAEIATIQNQLDNLKQQKKALMQQLLTGKRRAKVDSPALATQ